MSPLDRVASALVTITVAIVVSSAPASAQSTAEANKYVGGGSFLGAGLSFWDITHSDTFPPALMLHFGVPLGTHPAHPVYFLGEGRLFMKELDDISNNYQFWAGVRVHF